MRLYLTIVIVALQVIFNLSLLVSLIRKRKNRVVDPIHSTISAARQNNKQLNKINFISLIMCLNCLLMNFSNSIIMAVIHSNSTNITKVMRIRFFMEVLGLLILVSRVPTLILVSNRLKVEFVSMLRCVRCFRASIKWYATVLIIAIVWHVRMSSIINTGLSFCHSPVNFRTHSRSRADTPAQISAGEWQTSRFVFHLLQLYSSFYVDSPLTPRWSSYFKNTKRIFLHNSCALRPMM